MSHPDDEPLPDGPLPAAPHEAIALPIATADRSKSGYAFKRKPVDLANITLSLVYEKKIAAPAVVLLTDTEILIVGVAGLMRSVELYESKLRELIAQHSAWAAIQVVFAVLKSGDNPIMHLRAEVEMLDGVQSVGVVVFGFATQQDGVKVMAKPDTEFNLGTPFLLLDEDGLNAA